MTRGGAQDEIVAAPDAVEGCEGGAFVAGVGGGLGSASFPAWSRDGSKLAFASCTTTNNYDVWTVAANGTNACSSRRRLPRTSRPSWSPDGSKIAFQTNRDGDREIYVMDADGAHPTDLTNRHATEEESADWSTDGSKIVFSSTVPNGSPDVS